MTARPSAAEVSAELARRIEALCRELLSAGRRNGAYWSAGGVDNAKGGSLYVHLRGGDKQGHWTDEATGEYGDALDLLAACRYRGDKKAAYAAGLAWLGWSDTPAPTRQAPAVQPKAAADAEAERIRAYAQRVWLEAEPSIARTPVDQYLQARGIDLAGLGRQPRALRYHPDLRHRESAMNFAALVAAISGPDGRHMATHRTYLERVGGGWRKLRGTKSLSIGGFAGGSIRLSRGVSGKPLKDAPADEPVFIGEGIETCLSVAVACPELRVLSGVGLGNLGNVWLPEQVRLVILGADNDTDPQARAQLRRAVEQHLDAGRDVRVARSPEGNDFNDMIRITA